MSYEIRFARVGHVGPSHERSSLHPWRGARALLLASTLAFLAACGTDADPRGAGGTGGGGAGGAAGHGGAGGTIPPPDPLDLGSCDDPVGSLASSVELPALDWDGGDEHAAHCAFRALDAALEGKRIVCSGENDHGVSQSSRWHAALARYLVHAANVRTIALEMDAASVAHWNRYLTSGDASDLAKGFEGSRGSLGDSVEMERLVEALREVQAELPEGERLRLTGYDVAVQPAPTIEALADFLERVEPEAVETWTSGWEVRDFGDAAAHAELFLSELEQKRDAWIAATDEESWHAAWTNASNIHDGFRFLEEYARGQFGRGNSRYREPGMIRNAETLAARLGEGERLLLVGHNFHCARSMPASGAGSITESPALGTHLARSETWGSQYLVLGQLYLRGAHNSLTTAGIAASPFDSGASSLAGLLAESTEAPALLIGTDATEPRMDVSQDVRPFGTHSAMLVPREQFDGFLWVREVEPTELR